MGAENLSNSLVVYLLYHLQERTEGIERFLTREGTIVVGPNKGRDIRDFWEAE